MCVFTYVCIISYISTLQGSLYLASFSAHIHMYIAMGLNIRMLLWRRMYVRYCFYPHVFPVLYPTREDLRDISRSLYQGKYTGWETQGFVSVSVFTNIYM